MAGFTTTLIYDRYRFALTYNEEAMMKSAHRQADHNPMVHIDMGHMNSIAHHHMDMGHGHVGNGHAAMVADFRNRFWVSMILTVPILALSPLVQDLLGLRERLAFRGESYVLFGLSAVVYLYCGWPFLKGIYYELTARRPGMMTLIAVAISTAFFYSSAVVFGLPGTVFFWELATLVDVMLLGHWLQIKSIMRASRALEALVQLLPATAHRLKSNDDAEDVPITELRPGDRVLVKPGERVPIDGVITKGYSSFNESLLTGESRPVEKTEGQEAVGGAVNGEGAVTVVVRKTGDQTYLAQVIALVKRAQETRSRTQDLADRAALWLTYIALSVGGATLVAWLFSGFGFDYAIERMATVMVIACPHALGLAVPLVVAVSTRLTAQSGLLIRDRAAFERAHNLGAALFDKTGTLTEGRFGIVGVVRLSDPSENEILAWAAGLESQSEHPIAQGVVRGAKERNVTPKPVQDFKNLPGQGAEAVIEGHSVRVVSPDYVRKRGLDARNERIEELGDEGNTIVYLLIDDKPVGAIALADIIRKESFDAIARLKDMGIRCLMITGDGMAVAKSVAARLGLDDYFAEVLPHQKLEKVREVKRSGVTVAMIGDGVNDAPALVESDLGIAIGAGTEVAVESADVVLVRSDPRDVFAIVALSRATYRKIVQNLLWATGYNIVAIPLAAGVAYPLGVVISPAVGAALMSASTIIVAINAQLLARARTLVGKTSGAAEP
jgi:P-type Cu2+ transporter